tara:strand:+ start:569 stop:787 length:219 start_codon:yes stop_codon:yes gene_type:complete
MKRKTKEVSSTARPKAKKEQILQSPDTIVICVTNFQKRDIEKLALVDSHVSAGEWAKKQILRILADRSREII